MSAMEMASTEAVQRVKSSIEPLRVPGLIIARALSRSGGNVDAAVKLILKDPESLMIEPNNVTRTLTTIGGVRVSVRVKEEESSESGGSDPIHGSVSLVRVKDEPVDCGVSVKEEEGKQLGVKVKEGKEEMVLDCLVRVKDEPVDCGVSGKEEEGKQLGVKVKEEKEEMVLDCLETKAIKLEVEVEGTEESKVRVYENSIVSWKIIRGMTFQEYIGLIRVKFASEQQKVKESVKKEPNPEVKSCRPKAPQVRKINGVVVEDDDFPEEPDWFLVGRTVVNALSTSKGRKLVDNEIVHFGFPSPNAKYNSSWIVRFSTKRSGEVGRLPMEWAKCVGPLVYSSKVKVLGRCIAAPPFLHIMQEIMLYVSFYIHHSVFIETDKLWRLEPSNNGSTVYPLLDLFRLLDIKPYQKAEFTPEEVDSRKRSLDLEVQTEEAMAICPAPTTKRRRGCAQLPQLTHQDTDEQAISESTLNKIVGSADMYDLEEMEPPNTLTCVLKPYQKQALYWMSESEKGIDAEKAAQTLHPAWSAFKICDERASSIYLNIFSGEATTRFPTAKLMARGGILADAMGLGKTVMTIALILARPYSGSSDKRKRDVHPNTAPRVKGGTLIVCPMALLGQWNDELATHSKAESLSVIVYYGGDRTHDPRVMSGHDVVLTTYGVLQSAYKNGGDNSIFNRVDWYRVVLDEAHTIKSWRSQAAQAAFSLSSHCRWCLTGTPLQNSLDDVYSLLCFLRVEPWCNWSWWLKYIKGPYDNGDPKGLKLIKAVLRPLMLRRTKETRDKVGRPIVVLPPTDIQTMECEQSEAEHDFYDALFRRSKVQFDEFVAAGRVLHNYASILELLLRLRQCCNHPFLVMSRADAQHWDLKRLSRRFLEASDSPYQDGPTRAYVEEVIDGLQNGENTECPICMEAAEDPVFTRCAHRMCRECLLASWRTPTSGLCPICRTQLRKSDLIVCPVESKFDAEKNWKESSKVSKLVECLLQVRQSGCGQKSVVFSQWTSFLDLLEIPLRRNRIGFLRFDGKLSQKQREHVLREFSESQEKTVLLMSLKAGGVGLNLTSASNVFIMDPWWNPAVEEQAIMRIHRIGQKNTVRVRRFIVKHTVEERLQQVQARKQRMIAGALTDEEVRSARIEELKMLFR